MNKSNTLIKMYNSLIKRHFTLVQSVQAGLLMGTGDLIAQTVIEKKTLNQIQPLRTGQFFVIGAGLVGPTLTYWYKFLSKYVGTTGKSVVLKKVALDQLVFSPCFLAIFVTTIHTLQGKNWDYVKQELNHKYTDILLANYKLWPAVQLVNFYFVPLSYQVLLVQVVALVWNSYLSWKTQQINQC